MFKLFRQLSPVLFHPLTDKHETKLRGMIYFQAVEDVFFDHLKLHRVSIFKLPVCIYSFTYRLKLYVSLSQCKVILHIYKSIPGHENLLLLYCFRTYI